MDGVFPREDRGLPGEEGFRSEIETVTLGGERVLSLTEEPVGQSHTHSYQVSPRESQCPSEPHAAHDESYGASPKLSSEWGNKRGTQDTGGVDHLEGEHGSNNDSSSLASTAGSTPQDDNLLQNNEYAFIDLLHEVVQNQGRWTRDRWKQTHLNKQRSNKQ
ncbi:hypothetical protein AAFF_G00378750 [Aldrovandia affinis]|uniref:Uncharacterized protein n=1 Tax=Aldrovandia affinis TaxID=143900 RepID=A0AAD7SFK4_9TELE|nr:hypothetical protein AAFF_G00378750 [Aldrovandia affinis]